MVFLVKLLSIAVIIYGCVIILRPEITKKILSYLKEGNRMAIGGGIRIAVGLFLIVASYRCCISWIVLFLGALLIFGGVLVFVIKRDTLLKFIEKFEKLSAQRVMILGAVTLAIGILLAIAA